MNNKKKKYLKGEFLTLTINAALGRSKIYSNASDKDKQKFNAILRNRLEKMSEQYNERVTEEKHISNIKKLSNELSNKFSYCLYKGRFRIGNAQKALNLYLKYLWCVGLVETPLHFPIDSIVLSKISECKNIRWTTMDDINEYRKIINAAKKYAKDKSIAEWELENWNRRE